MQHLPLETAAGRAAVSGGELGALNDALLDLRRIDPQHFKIVALRCFVGLTAEETAAACGVSLSTVKRDWREGTSWTILSPFRRNVHSSWTASLESHEELGIHPLS